MREKTKQAIKEINGFDYEKHFRYIFESEEKYHQVRDSCLESIIRDISRRLKKLEILTKANDYELQDEKDKLVKK